MVLRFSTRSRRAIGLNPREERGGTTRYLASNGKSRTRSCRQETVHFLITRHEENSGKRNKTWIGSAPALNCWVRLRTTEEDGSSLPAVVLNTTAARANVWRM